jgi:hypothetical protein
MTENVASTRSVRGVGWIHSGTIWSVGLLTVLAALLRFPALDAKGFWLDEAVTVSLLGDDFVGMLERIPGSESTPPLYYILAWGWTHVFGLGEVGTRSLSALVGTALVPVAYLSGRDLLTRAAGIVTAALVAVNPLLVWFSQEARAYSLLTLLAGCSFLFFVRSWREPRPGNLIGWAIASSLAMATFYFAIFIVAAEAAWLLWAARRRRPVLLACALPAATGAALIALVVEQLENPRWIETTSLVWRAIVIPGVFITGFETPYPMVMVVVGGLLALVAVVLLLRTDPELRYRALVAGGVGLAAIVAPLVAALVGVDYLIYRNLVASVLPLAVMLAGGLSAPGARRLGAATAAALCVISVVVIAVTSTLPKFGKEDWRRAADSLGTPVGSRATVVTPDAGVLPLILYRGGAELSGGRVRLTEIALLAGARREIGQLEGATVPRPATPAPPVAGFAAVERIDGEYFTLVRYRSPTPVWVSIDALKSAAIGDGDVGVVGEGVSDT